MSVTGRSSSSVVAGAVSLVAGLVSLAPMSGSAQETPAVKFDLRTNRGMGVSPVYEGWYVLDGATYVLYGYYNRNLEEVVDVPIGPNNNVQPGPSDQNQPSRFFPGRHYGVVALPVPKSARDQAKTELTWTLTVAGQTMSIPAFLDPLYFVFPQREDGGQHPGNTPPLIRFEPSGKPGQGPLGVTTSRRATVGNPLGLDVWVTDDGLPPPPRAQIVRTPGSAISSRPQGLTVRWSVYRGPGRVSFSSQAPPLSDGKAQTTATFDRPGEYILHVLASDSRSGTMCCWTNGYVKVTVGTGEVG
jgi:hypothetical protein